MWKDNKKIYVEIAAWTTLVLVLSFACYLPMLLERNRVGVPKEKNIKTTALLHMLSNTCFIMPVSYNIILAGLSGTVMLLTVRKKSG